MKQSRSRRAFTVIEILVVVVIIAVLASIIAPRLLSRVGQSKQAVAKANAESLATNVRQYMTDGGPLESGGDLRILMERPSSMTEDQWKGPYVNNADELKDPWGNEFVLIVPGQFNVDFDVVSYGADGQAGGEGENKDLINGKKD
ncbi:MAG: type II secretion system major pseudopilin GspG [bacterium]|nr:type II secretion system major pseudopilin GspG [bacterium]